MKRLLVILALLLYVCMPASANIVSKPFNFVNGTVIDATKVNPDFDTLYTLVNGNIDSTNISNTLGIYASQILPTTSGQATFGSALGYTFYPNATNQVPLTLIGATGQTADLFDVFLTQAGTKAVWVGSGGVFNTAYAPVFGGPLGIGSGGTGATSAATVAGTGIAVSGTFPNQTVALSTPVAVANGGTGVTTIPTTTCLGWSGTAFTSPACATGGGSGVTSATSPITFSSGVVACATCAVTNANNNFSTDQTFNGSVLVGSGFTTASGDIGAARGTNLGGVLALGNGGQRGTLDRGLTTTGKWTFSGGDIQLTGGAILTGSSSYGPTTSSVNGISTANGFNAASSGNYAVNGNTVLTATAFNTKLFPSSSGGNIYFESFAGLDNMHVLDAGGLVLDRGNLSLTSGAISSTGTFTNTAGGVGTPNQVLGSAAGTATYLTAFNNSGQNAQKTYLAFGTGIISAVQGISASLFGIGDNIVNALAVDGTGQLGVASNIKSGGTIQGSSNGSAVSYYPPVYTPSGAAVASTEHGAQGNCTWGSAATSCTVTLSGAAAFAGAGTYNCTANPPAAALMSVIYNTNGTTFVIDFYNTNGSGLASVGASSVFFNCLGT